MGIMLDLSSRSTLFVVFSLVAVFFVSPLSKAETRKAPRAIPENILSDEEVARQEKKLARKKQLSKSLAKINSDLLKIQQKHGSPNQYAHPERFLKYSQEALAYMNSSGYEAKARELDKLAYSSTRTNTTQYKSTYKWLNSGTKNAKDKLKELRKSEIEISKANSNSKQTKNSMDDIFSSHISSKTTSAQSIDDIFGGSQNNSKISSIDDIYERDQLEREKREEHERKLRKQRKLEQEKQRKERERLKLAALAKERENEIKSVPSLELATEVMKDANNVLSSHLHESDIFNHRPIKFLPPCHILLEEIINAETFQSSICNKIISMSNDYREPPKEKGYWFPYALSFTGENFTNTIMFKSKWARDKTYRIMKKLFKEDISESNIFLTQQLSDLDKSAENLSAKEFSLNNAHYSRLRDEYAKKRLRELQEFNIVPKIILTIERK